MKRIIDGSVAIVAVLTIIAITFGGTYAFLIASSSSASEDLVKSGKLELVYSNAGGTLASTSGNTLIPVSSKDESNLNTYVTLKKADTSASGVANVKLNIDNLPSGLTSKALKSLRWEVYKDSDTTPYKQGTFEGASTTSPITLVENYRVTATQTKFTLYVWLDGAGCDGDAACEKAVIGLSIGAHLSVDATSKGTF